MDRQLQNLMKQIGSALESGVETTVEVAQVTPIGNEPVVRERAIPVSMARRRQLGKSYEALARAELRDLRVRE